jgi:hypothetical protein
MQTVEHHSAINWKLVARQVDLGWKRSEGDNPIDAGQYRYQTSLSLK